MTNAETLAIVEALIQNRGNADGYSEYTEGGERFKGATIPELLAERRRLLAMIAAETGSGFRLAEPFDV